VKVSTVKDIHSGMYEIFAPFIHFSSNLDVIEQMTCPQKFTDGRGFVEIQLSDNLPYLRE